MITFRLSQRVAVQRQLREHHQVSALGGGITNPVAGLLKVAIDVPKATVHLGHRDPRHLALSFTGDLRCLLIASPIRRRPAAGTGVRAPVMAAGPATCITYAGTVLQHEM